MAWMQVAFVVGVALLAALQAVRAAGVAAPVPARASRGRPPRRA